MDSSLERLRAKIVELEEKLASLRIAERELQDLEKPQAAKIKTTTKPKPAAKAAPKKAKAVVAEKAPAQTIGSSITSVLTEHGPIPASRIAELVAATGRDISNRAISFALQGMKRRSLVKNVKGDWTLAKGRSKRK